MGLVVALLGWRVGMNPPAVGLDPSWNAGLTMAVREGFQFGEELVFSYGPLGFLQSHFLWYPDLGVLAFLYAAGLYVAFCVLLCHSLRRFLPDLAVVVVAFLVVTVLPLLEQALLVSMLACLGLLEAPRSRRALNAFCLAAALFSGIVVLIKMSVGPVVVAIFVITLVGVRAGWQRLALFASVALGEALLLWTLARQELSGVPEFLLRTSDVVSGYSEAMLRQVDVAGWQVAAATVAAATLSVLLVIAASKGRYRDRRARVAGVTVTALASFLLFKQGIVRTDAGHLSLYFSTACVLWLALPWERSRLRPMLAGAALIALAGLLVRPPGLPVHLNPIANVEHAAAQFHALVSPGRRAELIRTGRAAMKQVYRLDPATRRLLRDRTVAVEPWEAGAAWAYRLRWRPLPVFQNYSAYTARLNRLNADAVASPHGPERLLRENQLLVHPEFPTPDLDGRFLGWDPPAQARAVLCHFVPLRTTQRWQVLGRVGNRCDGPRSIGSVAAAPGEQVTVPVPGPREVVFVRIEGAEVDGLERLATLVFHAALRELTVNGEVAYRVVPDTARDGLLLRADRRLGLTGPFSPVPHARTIALTAGGEDALRYSFYAVRVAPMPAPSGAAPDAMTAYRRAARKPASSPARSSRPGRAG